MDNTTSIAAFIELDGPTAAPVTATAAPAPVAAPVAGVTVLEGAKRAAEAEADIVKSELGMAMSPTFFALGTKMLECGEATAKRLRQEWAARPTVGRLCESIITAVKAEDRKDYENVSLAEVTVGADGRIARVNGGLTLTPHSYSQLAAMAPNVPAAAGLLRYNLNGWLAGSPKKALFRTRRLQGGPRQLFAALSTRYARFDIDRVAAELARTLPGSSRGAATYDGTRASFDVSLAGEHGVAGELGVGRLHRVGLRITTADDGSEAMRIRLFVERIACINCTILADEKVVLNRRHSGNASAFADMVSSAIANVGGALSRFEGLWSEANARHIVDSDGSSMGARAVFARLIDAGHIKVSVGRAVLLDELVAAWEREPGTTEAAYNRAITRAAHEGSWSSPWVTEELEEQAGEMLYQHVFVRTFDVA